MLVLRKFPSFPVWFFIIWKTEMFCRPNKQMGRQACENTSNESLLEGDVGAGCGATVGKLKDTAGWCNSGIGSWVETAENGITIAALIAVNAFGDVLEHGKIIAGTKDENGNFLTNVKLTKAQAAKVTEKAVILGVKAAKPL